jgi:hypothetical protein
MVMIMFIMVITVFTLITLFMHVIVIGANLIFWLN